MQSQTLARGIAAAVVIVAAALVLLVRAPVRLPPDVPADPSPPPAEDRPSTSATVDLAAQPGETPVDAKQRELEAMSETFRNTTFLIAIRDAGFACNELLRVSGGLDGAPKWMATCSEMLAYTVALTSNGTLHVEPTMQYWDGTVPSVIPLEQGADPTQQPDQRREPPRRLPPETR